jgi:Family of unknown function (DUF5763)
MKYTFILLMLVYNAIGCTSPDNASVNGAHIQALDQRITLLEGRIDQLSEQISKLHLAKNYSNKKQSKRAEGISLLVAPVRPVENQAHVSSMNNERTYSDYQCAAITKKGTRCKRTARSNGYCWQHGG